MTEASSQTSKLALIRLHYEERKHELTWNAAKFRRLAHALQLTTHELGAFIRLNSADVDRYVHNDRFPPTVELHLTLLARTIWFHDETPIFPDVC